MKRNLLILALALILVSTLTSCGGGGPTGPPPSGPSDLKISVSFVGKAGFSVYNFSASVINPITDETYFKDNRKTGTRGNLVNDCNPVITNFILDVGTIAIYTNNTTKPLVNYSISLYHRKNIQYHSMDQS